MSLNMYTANIKCHAAVQWEKFLVRLRRHKIFFRQFPITRPHTRLQIAIPLLQSALVCQRFHNFSQMSDTLACIDQDCLFFPFDQI